MVDSLTIDIPKDYIPLTDRRQDGVRYMDLDDQKASNPNPPVQLIKDALAEIGKLKTVSARRLTSVLVEMAAVSSWFFYRANRLDTKTHKFTFAHEIQLRALEFFHLFLR